MQSIRDADEVAISGRFDEIFIVMPPNTRERYEIISKRAANYKIPSISNLTLDYLVENTQGFSGAELDKLVKEVIYLAGWANLPNETN